ncbi:MAG TPA: MFS transporter, partial [Hyphomicrobium sp.]|nr:MFS transporter [Hyphomicrobium sp.]
RLEAIRERIDRAGATAEIRTLGPSGQGMGDLVGQADLVLVDAPCSGSGTWRRRPEAPWRLTPGTLGRFPPQQLAILSRAADLVRPGGRLVYITCSVFAEENEEVAAAFATARPEFHPRPIAEAAAVPALTQAGQRRLAELAGGGHTVQLTPLRNGTDGFFVALFERSA